MRMNSIRNGPSSNGSSYGRDLTQLRVAQQAVLVELRLDEPEREPRRDDDRHRALAHQVRQRADVILVAVREHDAADHVLALAEVREVRQDEVDAEVLVAREREPGVDDDDRVVRLVDGHVLADLAEAAERDDPADAHRGRSLGARPCVRTPPRSRQARTCSSSSLGRLDHRQPVAADVVAEQVERRLDRDRVRLHLQQVVGRRHLLVEPPRAVDVAVLVAPDHLLRLRPPDVRVHADAADAAELEEREDEVVVARVEVEAEARRCAAPASRSSFACLTAPDVLDLGELARSSPARC